MAKIALNYNTLIIDDTVLFYKNFAGRETSYNRLGNKNFCVAIPDKNWAEALQLIGWNVKKTENDKYILPVSVRLPSKPPEPIISIASKINGELRQTTYKVDDDLSALDSMNLKNVMIKIVGREYTYNNKTGIKAELESLWAEDVCRTEAIYLVYDCDEYYNNNVLYCDSDVIYSSLNLNDAILYANEYVRDFIDDTVVDMADDTEYFSKFKIEFNTDISKEEYDSGEYIQYYLRKKPRSKRFEHRCSIRIEKGVLYV